MTGRELFLNALLSMNTGQIVNAAKQSGVSLPSIRDAKRFMLSVHRYRVLAQELPMAERAASLAWLNKAGNKIELSDRVDAPQGGIEGRLYKRKLIEFGVVGE